MEDSATAACDWIDPFCPLLSDRIGVRPGDPPQPANPAATRTAEALAAFSAARTGSVPEALVDGEAASLEDALAISARLLSGWRQPLFGGLGTDVAGARALTRLGIRCGAILDHVHGEGMTQGLRALQDRGGFTCTLSEVRNRTDLILCIGCDPTASAPDFFRRCGFGEPVEGAPSERRVIFLRMRDATDDATATNSATDSAIASLQGMAGVHAEVLNLEGADLHSVVAELNAACMGRDLPRAGANWPALQRLAGRLKEARYSTLVHAPAQLPGRHAALLVEAIGRIIKTLNRASRAGTIALGAADGSATVNQTATWLTGLPLRTALHAHGFEHDPHRFGTRRLMQQGAIDGLLWVSSFSPALLPPTRSGSSLTTVVLAHPAMASAFARGGSGSGGADAETPRVFIPVSTPGVNAPGQLFRSDGGIVLALKPFATTHLPGVAEVAGRLLGLLGSGS